MSLTAICWLKSAKRKFSRNRRTSCVESKNHTFLGPRSQNESSNQQLARISEKKIFHEISVDHFLKVGIKPFWVQEAETSLTAMSSVESARKKFFIKSRYIMSGN